MFISRTIIFYFLQYRSACTMILMAHHLSNIADLTGEQEAQDEAFETIEQAIGFFEKVTTTFAFDSSLCLVHFFTYVLKCVSQSLPKTGFVV